MVLHRLQEGTIDPIDQVQLLVDFYVRVDSERFIDFVLRKLPAKLRDRDKLLVVLVLHRPIQVATDL